MLEDWSPTSSCLLLVYLLYTLEDRRIIYIYIEYVIGK